MTLAFAVQCSLSFRAQFRILQHSLERFHPNAPLIVYSYDGFIPERTVTGVILHDNPADITRDRPVIIRQMLAHYPQVCLLGADTELFEPLVEAEALLDAHDLVMVPHNIDRRDNPMGDCNADFQLWRATEQADAIVTWFSEHLGEFPSEQHCLHEVMRRFPGCCRWETKTHNVAWYNVQEYGLRQEGEEWRTDGGKLVMFHYSWFRIDKPYRLSRHAGKFQATGDLERFCNRYADLLRR